MQVILWCLQAVDSSYQYSIAVFEQVLSSSWDGRPFGHNRHRPKIGGCAPFWEGELGPSHYAWGWGLPPCQVSSPQGSTDFFRCNLLLFATGRQQCAHSLWGDCRLCQPVLSLLLRMTVWPGAQSARSSIALSHFDCCSALQLYLVMYKYLFVLYFTGCIV